MPTVSTLWAKTAMNLVPLTSACHVLRALFRTHFTAQSTNINKYTVLYSSSLQNNKERFSTKIHKTFSQSTSNFVQLPKKKKKKGNKNNHKGLQCFSFDYTFVHVHMLMTAVCSSPPCAITATTLTIRWSHNWQQSCGTSMKEECKDTLNHYLYPIVCKLIYSPHRSTCRKFVNDFK